MTPGCTSWVTGTAATATATVTRSRYVWNKGNSGSQKSIMANLSVTPRVLGLLTTYWEFLTNSVICFLRHRDYCKYSRGNVV